MNDQVPALLRSKVESTDHITIVKISPKTAYMFEQDYERGSGPLFETEREARACGEFNIIKVMLTRS